MRVRKKYESNNINEGAMGPIYKSQFAAFSVACLLVLAALDINAAAETTAKPSARWGHSFVYHPPSDSYILFGGASERRSYLNDTWVWNEEGWRRVRVDSPPARGFAAAVYNPERKSIMIHGGRGNNGATLSDLWEWDGTQWREVDQQSPFQSDHHAMVYLPDEKGVFLYGGWTGEKVTGETWFWDGKWKKLADGENSPPPRSAFGMTYHDEYGRVELYGGLWINGQYADSWAWENESWRQLSGPYDNSSLDHHVMFYDSSLRQPVIFGGKDYRYTMRHETLVMNSSGIVKTLIRENPSARHSVAIAYDKKRARGLLYGGKIYFQDEQKPLNDMWAWEAGVWREISQ